MTTDAVKPRGSLEALDAQWDQALNAAVPPLTGPQLEAVLMLRGEMHRLWNEGRHEEATLCLHRVAGIIREGPPPGE